MSQFRAANFPVLSAQKRRRNLSALDRVGREKQPALRQIRLSTDLALNLKLQFEQRLNAS